MAGGYLNQSAVVHHTYPITEKLYHCQVMRNKENRKAVFSLQMAEQIDDLCLDRYIQRCDRFICHQKLRLHAHGTRDRYPLPLSSGKF